MRCEDFAACFQSSRFIATYFSELAGGDSVKCTVLKSLFVSMKSPDGGCSFKCPPICQNHKLAACEGWAPDLMVRLSTHDAEPTNQKVMLRRSLKTKTRDRKLQTSIHKTSCCSQTKWSLFFYFPPPNYSLMRTWGQCNCCRKHCADQRCNLRENEVLSDDLIALVGQAEPQGFSDLSSWVNSTTYACMSVCVYVCVKSPEGKNASEDESGWGTEMIRPPTNDSTPSRGDLLDFTRPDSSVLSEVSQQECWLLAFDWPGM